MRTKKTVVVLISGKAGAGKSTISDYLNSKLSEIKGISVKQYGFADPIKYMSKAFIGWDGEKDDKGRKLLQNLGKLGREYDEDIWVKHCLNQLGKGIFPPNFVLVDDWRFPNELAYLKKNPLIDVITMRVFGRGGLNGDTALDISENSLPEVSDEFIPTALVGDHWYDFQIMNAMQLDILHVKLDAVLAEIQKQYIVE